MLTWLRFCAAPTGAPHPVIELFGLGDPTTYLRVLMEIHLQGKYDPKGYEFSKTVYRQKLKEQSADFTATKLADWLYDEWLLLRLFPVEDGADLQDYQPPSRMPGRTADSGVVGYYANTNGAVYRPGHPNHTPPDQAWLDNQGRRHFPEDGFPPDLR